MDQGKLKGKFLFVEHHKGNFEKEEGGNVSYDSVSLSDGLSTFKVKNLTGEEKIDFEKGAEVDCEFQVRMRNGKFGPVTVLELVAIEESA